jgi:transcriptional regulator with XRE-family HTH domain
MDGENAEFIALLKASEWSQAEAARRLRLDRATVSRYMSGEVKPSAPVLELFKIILQTERPGVLTVATEMREQSFAEWERKVVEDLRWLHQADRDRVIKALKALVEGLPRREPTSFGKTGSNLKEASEALDVSDAAEAAGLHHDPKLQRLSEADAPNARTKPPSRAASKASKGKRVPPK